MAAKPKADFIADPKQGRPPLTVKFTDQSKEALTWLWDLGDGTTAAEQNPTHIYKLPGKYTVKLTVTNAKGTDSKTNPVIVNGKPADPDAVTLKSYLKEHGHNASVVDALPISSKVDIGIVLRKLHGVDEATYRSAGGKL